MVPKGGIFYPLNTPGAQPLVGAPDLSTHEQEVAAFNANPAAVAKYGKGEEGMHARDQAEKLQLNQSELKNRIDMEYGTSPETKDIAPVYRRDAINAFKKAQSVYSNITDSTNRLKIVLDAAESGNKEAQAAAPLVMVQTLNQLANLRRLNPVEINNIKDAGSLMDKAQGAIGRIVAGKPIPPDVLSNARSLFGALQSGAKDSFSRAVQDINQSYPGAHFGEGGSSSGGAVKKYNPATGKIE
jgi:hypothetical protein